MLGTIDQIMDDIEDGEVFTAEIDRISNAGNGIVEVGNRIIIVGPMPRNAVDEKMKGMIKETNGNTSFALCLTNEYISTEYLKWASRKFISDSIPENEPKPIICKVDRISNNGNLIIHDIRYPQKILVRGSTEKIHSSDTVKIRLRKSSFKHLGLFRADLLGIVDDESAFDNEIEEWKEHIRNELGLSDLRKRNVDVRLIGSKTTNDSGNSSLSSTSPKLDSLRERAKEASVQNIEEDTVTRTEKTQQYTRSQEVREYVLARADGVCEGCGESAPFTSKTGEPYLHAHHVHELSDGGSDTPDTVIALCPNCHYRVHHGEDGDKYNQNLLEKVKSLEQS